MSRAFFLFDLSETELIIASRALHKLRQDCDKHGLAGIEWVGYLPVSTAADLIKGYFDKVIHFSSSVQGIDLWKKNQFSDTDLTFKFDSKMALKLAGDKYILHGFLQELGCEVPSKLTPCLSIDRSEAKFFSNVRKHRHEGGVGSFVLFSGIGKIELSYQAYSEIFRDLPRMFPVVTFRKWLPECLLKYTPNNIFIFEKFDLVHAMFLMATARCFLSVESQLTHIASSFDVPIINIFPKELSSLGYPYSNYGIPAMNVNHFYVNSQDGVSSTRVVQAIQSQYVT